MKWFGGLVLVTIVIAILSYVFVSTGTTTITPTPTISEPTPTPTEEVPTPTPLPSGGATTMCKPENLKSTIATEGAAGNIYGTLAIKNVSSTTCTVQGGEQIKATYSEAVKNLKVEQINMEGASDTSFTVEPGESIYSKVHYPNGPQCSGSTKSTLVTLTYLIASETNITFQTDTGNAFSVTTCTEENDGTTLQIWPLSEKPISQ